MKIENVKLRSRMNGRVALLCDCKNARYHVWLDPKTMDPGDTLCKNSIVARGHPDYFDTRRLETTSAPSQKIIDAMIAVCKSEGLLEKFVVKERKDKAKQQKEAEAYRRIRRIREAAPRMFDLLRDLIVDKCFAGPGGAPCAKADCRVCRVRALIDEIETNKMEDE